MGFEAERFRPWGPGCRGFGQRVQDRSAGGTSFEASVNNFKAI